MLEEQVEQATNEVMKDVGEYLLERAKTDPSVAKSIEKENKSLSQCFKYIMGEAYKQQKENCTSTKDDSVYVMAVHYYDEDEIKIESLPSGMQAQASTNMDNTNPTASTVKRKKEKPISTHKNKNDALDEQMALF